MKLYTLFSPSHQILYDEWFFPTLQDDFELININIEQKCPSGRFFSEGWQSTTKEKIKTFLKAAEENQNKYFVFSDVDIQFFKPVKEILLECVQDYDIALQQDVPNKVLCTGFFICQGNGKTRDLFSNMLKRHERFQSDQNNFNNLAKNHLKINKLPLKFWNIYQALGKNWEGEKIFKVPSDIVLHHANWTIGVENKINLLQKVRDLRNERKNT